MADSAIVTVQGRVTRREEKSGTKKRDDGSSYDWAMTIVTILVEETGTTELILPRNPAQIDGLDPQRGDEVAFLVEVTRSQRGFDLSIIRNSEAGKPSFPALVGAE